MSGPAGITTGSLPLGSLEARVVDGLRQARPGVDVGGLQELAGGHSGLSYTVRLGPRRCVVKAVVPTEKPVGRNDMLRQARVLRALAGSTVPVPAVIAVEQRQPAWFAMDFVDGDAVEPVLDEHALDVPLLAARMRAHAAVLRALHALDLGALDLAEPDRDGVIVPLPARSDPARELRRWTRTMNAVDPDLVPGAQELLRRLERAVPEGLAPVLVHGDFRLGNALCRGEEVVAVIDWEIWAPGDPRTDLGWFLLFTEGDNFPGVGRPLPGLPTEAELLEAYLNAGPPGTKLPDLDWFRALGRMKMAAIMGHNLGRHRQGHRTDPVQERLPPTIVAMIRSGLDVLG